MYELSGHELGRRWFRIRLNNGFTKFGPFTTQGRTFHGAGDLPDLRDMKK
jgi:hypothetical protein